MRKTALFAALAASLILLPLSSWAADGRARLNQVAAASYSEEDTTAEQEFGREVAARILAKFPLLEEGELTRYVGKVGTGLATEGGRPDLTFKFAILDTDLVNAFAAPGGYVFITKGALLNLQDEAELAAILAHEISHVSRRHIVRALNIKSSGANTIGALARLVGRVGEVSRVAMGKLVDVAEEILFSKGYEVAEEYQADLDAVALVGAVGYDPKGLDRYLARVEDKSTPEPASVKSTHPRFEERKARIVAALENNGLDSVKYPDMKERFNENVKLR